MIEELCDLYASGDPTNIELARVLEESLDIDISDWLRKEVAIWYCIHHRHDPSSILHCVGIPITWKEREEYEKTGVLPSRFMDFQAFLAYLDVKTELRFFLENWYATFFLKSKHIYLRYYGLDALPRPFVGMYASVEVLWACKNRFTELPLVLQHYSQLKRLNLSHNAISSIPTWIDNLQNLEELDLSYNQISELPEALFRLPKLQVLALDGNPLQLPDEGWSRLKSLYRLSLSDIPAPKLPEDLRHCTRLSELNINGMELEELPVWLCRLPLQRLSAQRNRLKLLPQSIYFWKLNYLDISYNEISELYHPHFRHMIEQEKKLYFPVLEDFTEAQLIPYQNEIFSQLVSFYFAGNRIKEIPKWIGNCKNLRYLNGSENPIESDTLVHIHSEKLQYIAFRNCQLKTLPYAFIYGKAKYDYARLDLRENPDVLIPKNRNEAVYVAKYWRCMVDVL